MPTFLPMRTGLLAAIALSLVLSFGGAEAATVKVSFADSARFPDGTRYDVDTQSSIRAHLNRLGGYYLRPGETLSITVLNIDLAGFDMSSAGPNRLRIYNGSTTPKIALRYRLTRGGKTVASGEDTVRDQFYLSRPGAQLSSDQLRYEKSMLDDWFREKFSAGR